MRGLGLAKGFDKSRTNGWFLSVAQPDGRRPKQYFRTEKERDRAFTQKVSEIRTAGVGSTSLSPSARQEMAEMQALAAPSGFSVMEIFKRGLAQLGSGVTLSKLTAGQASIAFLAEQKTRLADKKISRRRLEEVSYGLARFLKTNQERPLSECTRTVVKTYLTSLGVGPQTRVNHARILSFFFRWCLDEGMIFKDPVPEQGGVSRIPATFSNQQVDDLFACAWQHYPELVPMLGVQWYAGLRPGASHHLRWEHVDFDRRRILIHPHGNKLRQPDIVSDMPLTVFGLLLPFRQSEGRVSDPNHLESSRHLHARLGFRGKGTPNSWPEDVARHTFASNLYSLYEQDSKRVEAVLLHATSAMLKKHYLLKNVPTEAAAAYFARHLPSA